MRQVRAQQRDVIALADPGRSEASRYAVRSPVELTVRDAGGAADERLGLRLASRVLFEHRRQVQHSREETPAQHWSAL